MVMHDSDGCLLIGTTMGGVTMVGRRVNRGCTRIIDSDQATPSVGHKVVRKVGYLKHMMDEVFDTDGSLLDKDKFISLILGVMSTYLEHTCS